MVSSGARCLYCSYCQTHSVCNVIRIAVIRDLPEFVYKFRLGYSIAGILISPNWASFWTNFHSLLNATAFYEVCLPS